MKKNFILFISFFIACFLLIQNGNAQHRNRWMYSKKHFERPYFEMNYGLSKIAFDGFSQNFENASTISFKIGSGTKFNENCREIDYISGFLAISNSSTDLDFRDKSDEKLKSSIWQITAGKKDGYIIKTGKVGILPYCSNGFTWSYLSMTNLPDSINFRDDFNRLSDINKAVRFGMRWEGGIHFQIQDVVSFQLKYERVNVYPRHLFWAQTGSWLVEEAGLGMVDEFTDKVLYDYPTAGAILNFLLRNAYEFAIYELRSKEMNWPFGGIPSLNYSSVSFGVGFTF